MLKINW